MFILALKLALRNYRGKLQSVIYSRSCDMLIVATLLLATHFLIQYVWHLREQCVTLCWTVNMAFYVVITPLYNMAELNLLRAGHNMKLSKEMRDIREEERVFYLHSSRYYTTFNTF